MYFRAFETCVVKCMNSSLLVFLLHLKKTKVKLDFVNGINMLLMVEKGIRGEICHGTD